MLYKIHPLECDYGMGYTDYYLRRIDKDWKTSPKKRDYVDLFLSTTIAYGNMGWLVKDWGLDDPFGVEVMARSYYMMQQLQQQYAFILPENIEYADSGGAFHSPGQALARGIIEESRLRVEYRNGTVVYVNRSDQSDWTVPMPGGGEITLPPWSWLAFSDSNGFLEFSATPGGEGRRIDYVRSKEFEFLDGRGNWSSYGNLQATGSVAMRAAADGSIELIDIYGNRRIGFRAENVVAVTAFGPEGGELGNIAYRQLEPGYYQFDTVKNARKYLVRVKGN